MARRSRQSQSREIARALQDVGEHVLMAAKRGLQDGAVIVQTEAKVRVPVLTGKLRDSINVRPARNGIEQRIYADATNDNGFPYGYVVENSPHHGQPFLYPSLEAKRGEVIGIISTAIRTAIHGR